MSDIKDESLGNKLDNIAKKLDMILVILLAKSGVKQKEIADILGKNERTIRRWLPFREIQKSRKEE